MLKQTTKIIELKQYAKKVSKMDWLKQHHAHCAVIITFFNMRERRLERERISSEQNVRTS